MTIALHAFSKETGEFLSTSMVEIDPTIGDYPILSFTTTDEKPITGPNEVALYLDANGNPPLAVNGGTWSVKADYRGVTYWDAEHKRIEITEIGVTPPLGATMDDPGPHISTVKARRLAKLSKDCEDAITAGFTSTALGLALHYPAKLTDQTNLMASVVDSMRPALPADWATPFWASDANGNWEYRMHSAEQIQQVGADGKADILAKLQRKTQLEALIAAAQTIAEVEAVVWDEPQEPAE